MTKQARRIAMALGLLMSVTPGMDFAAGADLDDYVRRVDGAFAWTSADPRPSPQGTIHEINLTSQVWHDITWKHRLRIYEPKEIQGRGTYLLFITGGSNGGAPSAGDEATGFALAQACRAPCAMLHQVPNQPLLGGKKEDTLIAETFVRYLETEDATWPLLFPMVKSAVRAMDAVQQWAKREGKPAADSFVVTGASKRGWTTWLTGVADKRVLAIAPMVIDTLNMKAQNVHAQEVWGRQSEQIDDYTSRGLTEKFDTDTGRRLWMMVDPYAYRDRLSMPKLLINGTNDRYWTLDALNLYWDGLKDPKSVVYLPNAGHGLDQNRNYALNGIAALFRQVVDSRPMPRMSWKHSDTAAGRLRLEIESTPAPQSAQLWVATAPTRDFRDAKWSATPLEIKGKVIAGEIDRPKSGFIALLGDLEFKIPGTGKVIPLTQNGGNGQNPDEPGGLTYHLSTQVRQAGAEPDR